MASVRARTPAEPRSSTQQAPISTPNSHQVDDCSADFPGLALLRRATQPRRGPRARQGPHHAHVGVTPARRALATELRQTTSSIQNPSLPTTLTEVVALLDSTGEARLGTLVTALETRARLSL